MKRTLAAVAACTALAMPAAAVTVDLAFIMDESGSVGDDNYYDALAALSSALSVIPHDDPDVTYRVGVISFGWGATRISEPRVIDDDTDIPAIQADIAAEVYTGGNTNTQDALLFAHQEFIDAFGSLGDSSLINITTDGVPTANNGSCGSSSDCAIAAGNYVVGEGWDSISAEAVGQFDLGFLETLAYPNPVVTTADPGALPNPLDNGFVLTVADFDAYEAAILAKIQRIVDDTGGGDDTNPIPLPAGLPLLLAGLGAVGLTRIKRKKS